MVQAYNFLASWQLFPEKGTYENGERPKSGIYKIEAVPGSKELIIYHNWVTLENLAFAATYKILADGSLNEFSNHELADNVQAVFPDGITFEIHFYKKGEVILHWYKRCHHLYIPAALFLNSRWVKSHVPHAVLLPLFCRNVFRK